MALLLSNSAKQLLSSAVKLDPIGVKYMKSDRMSNISLLCLILYSISSFTRNFLNSSINLESILLISCSTSLPLIIIFAPLSDAIYLNIFIKSSPICKHILSYVPPPTRPR